MSEPPRKKQKAEKPTLPTDNVYATDLVKVPSGLPSPLSPGAAHGCRVTVGQLWGNALIVKCYMATANQVYTLSMPLNQHGKIEEGKEGVMLPKAGTAADSLLIKEFIHRGEIQTIASCPVDSATLLASIDIYGTAVIGKTSADPADNTISSTYTLQPQARRESGWAGITIRSESPSTVATARHFAKDITIYDGQQLVRTFTALQHPSAIKFLPPSTPLGSHILAAAEAHMVCLYDIRAGEQGGCVQRLHVSSQGQALHALDWCTADGGLLGCAGAERSVFLVEPRKWRTAHKFVHCVKHSIYNLSFASSSPRYCFVNGLDFEVLCGRWDKPVNHKMVFSTAMHLEEQQPLGQAGGLSFRGDSKWMGVAKAPDTDVVVGLGESGNVVMARVALQE